MTNFQRSLLVLGIFILVSFGSLIYGDSGKLNPLVNQGLQFLAVKKYDVAISSFEKAIKQNENDLIAWTGKCKAEVRMGRNDDALKSYLKVKQILKSDYLAYHAVYSDFSDDDDAVTFRRFITAVIRQNPNQASPYLLLGMHGFETADRKLLQLAESGLATYGTNQADIYFFKAVDATLGGYLDLGKKYASDALIIDPNNEGAKILNRYWKQEKIIKAVKIIVPVLLLFIFILSPFIILPFRKKNLSTSREVSLARLVLAGLLFIPPIIGYAVSVGVEYSMDTQLRDSVQKAKTNMPAEQLETLTVAQVCSNGTPSGMEEVCGNSRNLDYVKMAAQLLMWMGLLLIIPAWLGGLIANKSRRLLLWLFKPGLYFTVLAVVIYTLVNSILLIGCVYYGESALIHSVHIGIIFAIGLGALGGAYIIIKALISALHKASTVVIGRKLSKEEQPRLWDFISTISKSVGASMPDNIVVGLDPNFYVTEAMVKCMDGTLEGRTMYLSLPLCRIFTQEELKAVVCHELGHYVGFDTKYSLKFYPIYRGLSDSLMNLEHGSKDGSSAISVLPARIILGFFLGAFSTAENKISRERELKADQIAAKLDGEKNLATALIKLHAFTRFWGGIVEAMKRSLSEGKSVINASSFFDAVVRDNAKAEILDGLEKTATAHPTDTHPPLGVRLEALGTTLQEVSASALRIPSANSAHHLLNDYEDLEKELSELSQVIMIKSGAVTLPSEVKKVD